MQTTKDFQTGRIKITKLEAARRQLETAITLYFSGGDPVSTHTLASAAAEILKGLNDVAKGTPMLLDLEASGAIRPDKLKLARKAFRNPQNFFKHADEDPEGVLDFHPEIPSGFIIAGVEKYRELSGENPPIMRVFAFWFRTHWPELYRFSNGEETVLKMTKTVFKFEDKAKFFAHFLPLYADEAAKVAKK
jgi:hypothetical protein